MCSNYEIELLQTGDKAAAERPLTLLNNIEVLFA